jgi:hypothetical protein
MAPMDIIASASRTHSPGKRVHGAASLAPQTSIDAGWPSTVPPVPSGIYLPGVPAQDAIAAHLKSVGLDVHAMYCTGAASRDWVLPAGVAATDAITAHLRALGLPTAATTT